MVTLACYFAKLRFHELWLYHARSGVTIPPPFSLSSVHPRTMCFNPSNSVPPTFSHPRPFVNRYKPSDTIIVKKIPRNLNTITKISSHFEKFGTIVNIKVCMRVGLLYFSNWQCVVGGFDVNSCLLCSSGSSWGRPRSFTCAVFLTQWSN